MRLRALLACATLALAVAGCATSAPSHINGARVLAPTATATVVCTLTSCPNSATTVGQPCVIGAGTPGIIVQATATTFACDPEDNDNSAPPVTPAPQVTAPTLDESCVIGWDLNYPGGFTTTAPSIPGGVAFSSLDAFNYNDQGAPWLYPSWAAFLASMKAAEITLTNPPAGLMTPTQNATVVYYNAQGTELSSDTVSISNTELMPGQSSSGEDSAPTGATSCQAVGWS